MSSPNSNDQGGGKSKKINRGTNNELEILAMIVLNHTGLKITVMEKIKQTKRRTVARLSRSSADKAG